MVTYTRNSIKTSGGFPPQITQSTQMYEHNGGPGFSITIDNPVDVAVTADRATQDGTSNPATTADGDYTATYLERDVRAVLSAEGHPDARVRAYPTIFQPYLRRVVVRVDDEVRVAVTLVLDDGRERRVAVGPWGVVE